MAAKTGPQVGAKLSYTVNLGNFNSAKIEIEITDVDANADVATQLEQAVPALQATFEKLIVEGKAAVKEATTKS